MPVWHIVNLNTFTRVEKEKQSVQQELNDAKQNVESALKAKVTELLLISYAPGLLVTTLRSALTKL